MLSTIKISSITNFLFFLNTTNRIGESEKSEYKIRAMMFCEAPARERFLKSTEIMLKGAESMYKEKVVDTLTIASEMHRTVIEM